VLEKDASGRWHYHLAIEPPAHLDPKLFGLEIRSCWANSRWSRYQIKIEHNADRGWIRYLLKARQKSGLEGWFDCIDLEIHNPVANA